MTVKMILRGKVVLSKNGKDEILEMEEEQSSEKGDRSLEVPWTELPQDLTLKRIKVEDAFSKVMD